MCAFFMLHVNVHFTMSGKVWILSLEKGSLSKCPPIIGEFLYNSHKVAFCLLFYFLLDLFDLSVFSKHNVSLKTVEHLD